MQKRLRSMASHTARVGSLSWNDHVLSRYSCFVISDTKHKNLNLSFTTLNSNRVCVVDSHNISLPHSGSRSGHIHHHDVRVADHHIATLSGHSQEVCGLQWSPDGRYLASGGNDNLVCVWPRVQEGSASNSSQVVRCWSEHQGAVKVNCAILELTSRILTFCQKTAFFLIITLNIFKTAGIKCKCLSLIFCHRICIVWNSLLDVFSC